MIGDKNKKTRFNEFICRVPRYAAVDPVVLQDFCNSLKKGGFAVVIGADGGILVSKKRR
jgi:hypothetical protein